MEKFNSEKNGYNKKQVDDYITKLTNDYEKKLTEQKMRISDMKREMEISKQQLNAFKERNSNISDALVVAVETAKQIENSSKNIYDLEIKRVRSLYDKWKSFLDDFMKKYPNLRSKYDTNLLLKVFEEDINNILEVNKNSIQQKEAIALQTSEEIDTNTIGLKMLLSKMNNVNSSNIPLPSSKKLEKGDVKVVRKQKPSEETLAKYQVDLSYAEEEKRLSDKIKPITNMTRNDEYENLVDSFLKSDDADYENAYSKILLEKQKNDSFNLKDAVTPTEDLEEIMKSFSFYPDNEEEKNDKK